MDIQKAGDNSQQLKVDKVVIYQGIDEKRAREIFDEKFEVIKRDFVAEAFALVAQRKSKFLDIWEEILRANPAILGAFADPSFLMLLPRAARTAATTDKTEDYELLSNLLAKRAQEPDNNYAKTGIRKAISIVEEISDEALQGLTMAHIVLNVTSKASDVSTSLKALDNYYGHLLKFELPQGRSWIDQLDLLDAIRVDSAHSFWKYEDTISRSIKGIVNIGFKKDSPELEQAYKILTEYNLPSVFIVDNPLLPGYARLEVTNEKEIDNYLLTHTVNGKETTIPLTEEQKQALHRIYDMQIKDEALLTQVKAAFAAECDKYPNIAKVKAWWNNIKNSFDLTAAGKVLAYANSQRHDPATPALDFKSL